MTISNRKLMENYRKPNPNIWKGRKSDSQFYLHEKIVCIDLNNGFEGEINFDKKTFAFLGYACDEGVRRNLGRIGAIEGPDSIRTALSKLANHLEKETQLIDIGNVVCEREDMETCQAEIAEIVKKLLDKKIFPVLLGGGHDIVYGHYQGIRNYLSNKNKGAIGIINFDAHFDLRTLTDRGNSGTAFYQIATESKESDFHYLCLGIQQQSNIRTLFETARKYGVAYLTSEEFTTQNMDHVKTSLHSFIEKVDHIYVTIDLDGFSSAIAPGVSAPSPFGFSADIVLQTLRLICQSGKLISVDLAELNPVFDADNSTARLAAGLVVNLLNNPEERDDA